MPQSGSGPAEAAPAKLWGLGRAAYPEIELDEATFSAHLARCGAKVSALSGALHAEDLFLACAALSGNPSAVEKVRAACCPSLARYLRALNASPPFAEEVEQRLWETMLVGSVEAPPRLAAYSGRGSLAGFVGVSGQRLAMTLLRHRRVEARAAAGARVVAGANGGAGDAELDFIKEQYREGFQQSVRDALEVLDDRERMILRLQVIDGLTVDRIAGMYGVSQSTVSRWLAGARERVLAQARGLVRERLLLSESEFESVARLLASQLDVSVSSVLRARG